MTRGRGEAQEGRQGRSRGWCLVRTERTGHSDTATGRCRRGV